MQDLTERRRDRLTAIISHAHARLQSVLVEAGIDPAVARVIAATRVHQILPPTIRQQLAAVETVIATRMITLFRDVAKAEGADLDSIPTE